MPLDVTDIQNGYLPH